MGWSCRADAMDTLNRLQELLAPRAEGGPSNGFKVGSIVGFWETSRREHPDGAITGTVWRNVDATHVRKAGSFRIEGDGRIKRFPLIPREILRKAEKPVDKAVFCNGGLTVISRERFDREEKERQAAETDPLTGAEFQNPEVD